MATNVKKPKTEGTKKRTLKLGEVRHEVTFKSNAPILNDQVVKSMIGSMRAQAEAMGFSGTDSWMEDGPLWAEWKKEQNYIIDDLIWQFAKVWQKLRLPRGYKGR